LAAVVVQMASGHGQPVELRGYERTESHQINPNLRASSGRAGPTYSKDIVRRDELTVFAVPTPRLRLVFLDWGRIRDIGLVTFQRGDLAR